MIHSYEGVLKDYKAYRGTDQQVREKIDMRMLYISGNISEICITYRLSLVGCVEMFGKISFTHSSTDSGEAASWWWVSLVWVRGCLWSSCRALLVATGFVQHEWEEGGEQI